MKMKKRYLSYILVFSLSFVFLWQSVFAVSGELNTEKRETVQQMQENIESLEREKIHLDFKWDTYRIWNSALGELIKPELSEKDKEILEEIIIDYKDSEDEYEGKVSRALESWKDIEQIKKDFLYKKQDFYLSLIKYIQLNRLEEYTEYVNSDLNYNERSNSVATEIEQKNIEKEERIEEIQNQIESNTNILRERIREKVTSRVTARLNLFITEEKFNSLSNGWKIIVFQKLQWKVQIKMDQLKSQENIEGLEEKLFPYEVIMEILQKYIDDWNK